MSEFLALAEVSLVSQHLIVDLVIDVEELGDDLPVLEDADQLHDPPLHLLAGPAHLGQQGDVLWVFLTRDDLREQLAEDLQVALCDLDVSPQLLQLSLCQSAQSNETAPTVLLLTAPSNCWSWSWSWSWVGQV